MFDPTGYMCMIQWEWHVRYFGMCKSTKLPVLRYWFGQSSLKQWSLVITDLLITIIPSASHLYKLSYLLSYNNTKNIPRSKIRTFHEMSPTILCSSSSHTTRELIKQPVMSVSDHKEKTEYLKYTCNKSNCTAYSRCAECQEEEERGFIYQGGDHLYYSWAGL
jgi:hypothetical protein